MRHSKNYKGVAKWIPVPGYRRTKELLFPVSVLLINWISEVCVAWRKETNRIIKSRSEGEKQRENN